MIKIGLLGLGTVGSGVYEIIKNKHDYLKKATGKSIEISKILVQDKSKDRGLDLNPSVLTESVDEILNDKNIDIIVEVMGGIDKAYDYMTRALSSGKHVVTANKAVISLYIKELHELAEKNNCGILYEASVAGGVPILKNLKEALKINKIDEINGILNGTTNFILTKMYDEDLSFDEALSLAHKLGYAEADPTDDVEGYDAARKISIMASLAYGTNASIDDVFCFGIKSIRTIDITESKKMNLVPKLVASSIRKGNKFSAAVEPVLVDQSSLFASVKDAFNIVSLECDTVGELQFFGQGAGKDPTANAVMMDVIDIISGNYKEYVYNIDDSIVSDMGNLFNGFHYLRISVEKEIDKHEYLKIIKSSDIKCLVRELERDIILITEKISSNRIEQFVNDDLNLPEETFSYLRIENDKFEKLNDFYI